jgi:hypothetical protein
MRHRSIGEWVALTFALGAAGCGASTGLDVTDTAPDAGTDDASPNCGTMHCDPAAQYCFEDLLSTSFSCRALPAACSSGATCACVGANVPQGPCVDFGCMDGDGIAVVTCAEG